MVSDVKGGGEEGGGGESCVEGEGRLLEELLDVKGKKICDNLGEGERRGGGKLRWLKY